jgi:hypothetical protein
MHTLTNGLREEIHILLLDFYVNHPLVLTSLIDFI